MSNQSTSEMLFHVNHLLQRQKPKPYYQSKDRHRLEQRKRLVDFYLKDDDIFNYLPW